MKYAHIREEELKNKVAQDYFYLYDCTRIIGNVDFCVAMLRTPADGFIKEQNTPPNPLTERELKGVAEEETPFNLLTDEQNTPPNPLTEGELKDVSEEDENSELGENNSPSQRGEGGVKNLYLKGGIVNKYRDKGTEDDTFLLWAEAKKGVSDIYTSLVQLILTIGKARTFDKYLPPAFLGAFDAEKIAFIPYSQIHEIFYINDFNWNVTPSNYHTKEFQLIHSKVAAILDQKALLFFYEKDDKELQRFIKLNFVVGKLGLTKTKIDKNNFMVIYNKWLQSVRPTIAVNWDIAKKSGIIDGDFYLADLLSQENITLKEKLFVLLKTDYYELDRKLNEFGLEISSKTGFTDKQVAHTQFWNKYDRPPKEEYWDYIVERRDLLVPQDVRERKGSFFTPQIWVELSQKYLTDVLGEDWQDEYYIWDCAAGTGNLLAGLTNKYNIWASTLDTQDVDAMKDRIKNGANLLEDHVFQFDFLNDDFFPLSEGGRGSKLPQSLQNILKDPEKRKKLIIYMNPPYAEAGNAKQKSGTGENKGGTAIDNKTYLKYKKMIGKGSNELFAQFLIRIYSEIPQCKIAEFSTLKILQSSNFSDFRKVFRASLDKIFLVPADTFDNVKGQFPIGFKIWNTQIQEVFIKAIADVYDRNGKFINLKNLYSYDDVIGKINNWLKQESTIIKKADFIGNIHSNGNDFQHQNDVFIDNDLSKKTFGGLHVIVATQNIVQTSILFSVRHCIEATWLNDRDQFLYPNDGWQKDTEFQNDCLAFTLFHGQNRITSKEGINHWIPFTEQEINAREKFESNFMTQFIKGKIKSEVVYDLFTPLTEGEKTPPNPLTEGELKKVGEGDENLELGENNSPSERGEGGVKNLYLQGGVKNILQQGIKITPEYLQSNDISTKGLIFSDLYLPYNPKLKENSRDLRKARNLAEVLLWNELKADKFLGYSFQRQKPILHYIADFYCKELSLVIEIDGSSHDNKIEYDTERDRQMKVIGLKVVRIKDDDVKKDMVNVLRVLENEIDKITAPAPLTEGELKGVTEEASPSDLVIDGQETPSNFLTEEQKTPPNPLTEGELEKVTSIGGELRFSETAKAVFEAGRELWRYYHAQKFPLTEGARGSYNVNASLYDIREHFQGRNDKGKMNNKSEDEQYMKLIGNLREKLKELAKKIEPKVYEYEFLKA